MDDFSRLCVRCQEDTSFDVLSHPRTAGTTPMIPEILLPEEEDSVLPGESSCALVRLHNGIVAWGSQVRKITRYDQGSSLCFRGSVL